MAIIKKVPDNRPNAPRDATRQITQPSFSYEPTDALADVIVQAWTKPDLYADLTDRDNGAPTVKALNAAKTAINGAGFDLERPVIITEQEHDDNWVMQDEKEVVFVLPNKDRVAQPPAHSLLLSAKLLMAATPNGI
jgi:hypothetical protein